MNVLPAVCDGLLGLLALRAGSTISAMAAALPPSPSWSLASIIPPSLPMSCMAARRRELLSRKNGSRSGNMRPNRSSRMTKARGLLVCACTARANSVLDTPDATAPAPSAPRKCRRLIVRDHSLRCLMDVTFLHHFPIEAGAVVTTARKLCAGTMPDRGTRGFRRLPRCKLRLRRRHVDAPVSYTHLRAHET